MRNISNGHHLPERPQELSSSFLVYIHLVYMPKESGILLFSDDVLKLPELENMPQVLASASILKVYKIYQLLTHYRALRTLQE